MLDISVIILTYNEEIHVERCLNNAKKFAKEIFIVDSFSTDKTVEIAKKLGAKVYQNPWINYSKQFNWGLENLPITTEWVWRMDADEYLSDKLINELHQRLPQISSDVNGFTVPCLRIFMGKHIKHGIIPLILLRLFRVKYAMCENRFMDEHIQISDGIVEKLNHPFYDDNLNGLTWWTTKHNGYATREAIDLLLTEYGVYENTVVNSGEHSSAIRKKKLKYIKMPLFWRAFAFFFLRYFIRLGFLDGKEGFLWHFLQGWWYRTLADAKVYEIKQMCYYDKELIMKYLEEKYDILANEMLTNINEGGVKQVYRISVSRSIGNLEWRGGRCA